MFSPADLDEWQVATVRDVVAQRCGFYLGAPHARYLRLRIAERIREKDTGFPQYLAELQDSPIGEGELQTLVERLCIYETSFMRDPADFRALTGVILPRLARDVREQGRRRLRLISAGCSTGQEAYSLAMVVHESHLDLGGATVEVTGLDLSADALVRARQGRYGKRMVAALEPWRRQLYFVPGGEEFELVPWLKDRVRFMQVNLTGDLPVTQVDVIFCRNVLIYLDKERRYRVVRSLLGALRLGGYLVVGAADSVSAHRDVLEPVRTQGTVVFRRVHAINQNRDSEAVSVAELGAGTSLGGRNTYL